MPISAGGVGDPTPKFPTSLAAYSLARPVVVIAQGAVPVIVIA